MSDEQKVLYGKPDKTVAYFGDRKYNYTEDNTKNKSGTIRWRCAGCGGVSFTTRDDIIIRLPNANQKHDVTCNLLLTIEIECSIEYEGLKHDAKNKDTFGFTEEYARRLESLIKKYPIVEVSKYFPRKDTARSTCKTLKGSNIETIKNVKNTRDLIITEAAKFIKMEGVDDLFLQFDNEDKEGNRILIFFTRVNADMMALAIELHFDGTFKTVPIMFFQLLTIQAVIKNSVYPCAFILLENKKKTTYISAMSELIKIFKLYKIELKPKRILTDYETALQDCFAVVFSAAELKGCYFHYNQCLYRKVQALGLVETYRNDYKFRNWICKFYTLPLIPVDHLEEAFSIICRSVPFHNETIEKFIEYFIKQWLKGIIRYYLSLY
jgi:hypothetical protein